MGRPGITYFDVAKAADELVGQGKQPTIEAIRALIGTGSSSTIAPFLRTWKSKQDETQRIASKERLPEEFVSLMKGLWERVVGHAEEQITTIEQTTQEIITQLKQEIQNKEEEKNRSQQQAQQFKQEKDGLFNEKQVLEQHITQAQIERVELQAKYEGIRQQVEEKQTRIDELHHQNQQTQANLEHYRTASMEQRMQEQHRHEQQEQQLEQSIKQLQQEIINLTQEKITLEQQTKYLLSEKESLQGQLEKNIIVHKTFQTKQNQTENELAQKNQLAQHWEAQYVNLEKKWEEQSNVVVELQKELAVLSQKYLCEEKQAKDLSEQLQLIAHEKWTLGQEKAQLFGQLKQLDSIVRKKHKETI